MTNAQIAAVFAEIGEILEFQGANSFRVRAYRNAARTLHDYPEPLVLIADDPNRSFTDIEGIGTDLAEKIGTLLSTGQLPQHQELIAEVKPEVLAMLRIPGLGPKKAAALHRELNIQNLAELKQACLDHKVQELKGFGAKTEETILKGIDLAAAANERLYWAEADQIALALRAHLQDAEHVKALDLQRLELAGSYRRGKETVGDLDVLVVSQQPDAVMDRLGAFPDVVEVLGRGGTKMSVRLRRGFQVDLRVVPAEAFGAAWLYFTGSQQHNIVLRGMAKDRGLKVNEYGVFRGEERVAGLDEESVYKSLGLPWIPPPLREARREFDWAAEGKLPRLIELADLRGDLHMHTTESDGAASLAEMVAAAQRNGLQYLAITDHSQRVTMANGLDGARLRKQWAEIEQFNAQHPGFRVLKGVECDILERGGMDLPDDVLAEADWVVASVHYGQNQPRDKITQRIVDAIRHPSVSVVGHPTGRLINRRAAYEVDLETVYRAAADYGKFLELNASYQRLDLDDVACAAAKAHGIRIVISSDAHSVEGLAALRYGILQAQRAGLTAEDVVNARPWADVEKLLSSARSK